MGRLIDTSNIRVKPQYMQDVMGIAMIRCEDLSRILADVPTVEAIPKSDYENRLKEQMMEVTLHWIDNADSYKCPICYYETTNPVRINYKCPQCGFVDVNDLGKINALEGKNEQRKEKTQENI